MKAPESFLPTTLAALLAVSCTESGSESPAPVAASHVGAVVCAGCHAAEHARWQGSHHDLAMQEVSEQTVLGDFGDVSFTHFGATTTFSRKEGAFMVRTDGPDGTPQDYRVKYVFGVTPLQQYLIELERGHLHALGVCWDSRPRDQGGQRWFHLYPDEAIGHDDELHWTGPNQNWNYMCASCHSTNLRKGYDQETDSYATRWSEIDVACEACHGPGSRHVAWAEAGATAADHGVIASLRAPHSWQMPAGAVTAQRQPALAGSREIETCAPCHARRSVVDENVVPGGRLLDTHRPALLDELLYHADGQIQDEVYVYGSFVQSKMYHAGVTCSDCHDPHSLRLRASGNTLCAGCHDPGTFDSPDHHFHPAGSTGAQCVECHMPSRHYMVVDPRRDHSIRIPRPDLSVTLGTPNACNGCHAEETADWAAGAIAARRPDYRAAPHWAEALHAGRHGSAGAAAKLAALASDTARPAIARATAYTLLARYPGPELVEALRPALGDADPLVRLGALGAIEGLPAQARVALAGAFVGDPVRAVRVEAARLLNPLPRSEIPAALHAAFDAALAELVAFQRTNADQSWAHVNLGLLHFERQEFAPAEAEYRRALELGPRSIQAHVNLADLYRELGRDADAEKTLRGGLAHHGDSAEMHHALGLVLVRMQRLPEALRHLALAARARPEIPRFAYVHAVALHSTGDAPAALRLLEQTHARHPTDRDVLQALVSFHGDAGDPRSALEWGEKLLALVPEDRGVQQLLAELRTRVRE